MRVVHYLNQFFGGIGGEEKAGLPLEIHPGALGPGRALPGDSDVVATIICGDNYAAEHLDEVAALVVDKVKEAQPDLLVAGPCFGAGRYGVAAATVCVAVQAQLGIPVITGMDPENPGVDLCREEIYIVDSGQDPARMKEVLARMMRLGVKLIDGELPGLPSDEGYIPRGTLRSQLVEKTAAQRLGEMLLAKLRGQPFESEVPVEPFESIPAPPPVSDLSRATIALVTDGGLVPKGNPDNFPRMFARVWGAYDITHREGLVSDDYEVAHGGYDNTDVEQDPHRLVPVDVLREMEREGLVGKLHNEFLSTTGNRNPLENSRRVGREMVRWLRDAGVDAVILTST